MMSKKKVAYVFPRFPVGSQAFAESEVNVLRKLGVNVEVYTLLNGSSTIHTSVGAYTSASDIGLRRIAITCLSNVSLLFHLIKTVLSNNKDVVSTAKLLLACPLAIALAIRIREDRIDHVHLFWTSWNALVAIAMSKISDATVSNFMGAYDLVKPTPIIEPTIAISNVVTTHAKVNLEILYEYGVTSEKTMLSYRGVDVRSIEKHRISLGQKLNVIILAGRLIKEKQITKLAEVLSEHANRCGLDEIWVFGDGPMRPIMEHLEDRSVNIRYYGHTCQETLWSYMAKAKYIALPSISPSERLPNIVKEAMCLGVVPLVSNSPGIGELVCENSGKRVDDDLLSYVRELESLNNPESEWETMSALASEKISVDFDSEKNLKAFIRRIENL
jgi:glycosyltransferase involved in cell wall biosynthesis